MLADANQSNGLEIILVLDSKHGQNSLAVDVTDDLLVEDKVVDRAPLEKVVALLDEVPLLVDEPDFWVEIDVEPV